MYVTTLISTPTLVFRPSGSYWLWRDGTRLPYVGGGDGSCGCGTETCSCAPAESFGSTSAKVTDKAWDGAASRFTDEEYEKACAACDPGDGTVKDRCFLPHHEPNGDTNSNGVHSAAQRVSSLKNHNADAVGRAKSHLRSHYKDLGEDPPDSIAATIEELAAFDEAVHALVESALIATGAPYTAEAVTAAIRGDGENPHLAQSDRERYLTASAALYGEEDAERHFVAAVVAFADADGDDDGDSDGEGHGTVTATHSHAHPAYGAQGGDATHDHEHTHSGDASHDHSHEGMSASATVTPLFAAPPAAEIPGFIPTAWGYTPARTLREREDYRRQAKEAMLALVQAGRLTAAAGDPPDGQPESRWHAYIFVEGIRTTDHRGVAMEATTWRDLPLPLEWARSYEGGHFGKIVVGSMETIERVEGPMGMALLYAEGTWDLGSEDGAECARQVALQGGTRWVSADVEVLRMHTEGAGGGEIDIIDIILGDVDDDDWCDVLDEGRVMGATVTSNPAFPQCVIAPASVELPLVEPTVQTPTLIPGLVASARPIADLPVNPPAAWFENPNFTRGDPRLVTPADGKPGCPITITDDGHIYGHAARWGVCHTGFPGNCTPAPHSRHDYAYYRTGTVRTAEGTDVAVGQLTIATGHAAPHLAHRATAAHYDNTGAVVADLACGEDEFGIWVSGALRPGITDEQLRTVRACSPSGDWRLIGGSMEMVGLLGVNVPGFPVPRSIAASLVAAGVPETYDARPAVGWEGDGDERRQVSLVAAGRVPRHPLREFVTGIRAEMAALRSEVEALRPLRDRMIEEQAAEIEARISA